MIAPTPTSAISEMIRSSTALSTAANMPIINKMNEPEMPGKIMAQIASAPAPSNINALGSDTGPDWNASTKNSTRPTARVMTACCAFGSLSNLRATIIEPTTRPKNKPAIDSGWLVRALSIIPERISTAEPIPATNGNKKTQSTDFMPSTNPPTSPLHKRPRAFDPRPIAVMRPL